MVSRSLGLYARWIKKEVFINLFWSELFDIAVGATHMLEIKGFENVRTVIVLKYNQSAILHVIMCYLRVFSRALRINLKN